MSSGPMRWALIAVGLVALALGSIGVFLPLIPTTPFLLLAAFCFARTSTRLHAYLMNHRIFGRYLREYREGRMSTSYKIRTLALMWTGLLFSMWMVGKWWAIPLLGAIGCGVTVHIMRLHPSEAVPAAGAAGAGNAPAADARDDGDRAAEAPDAGAAEPATPSVGRARPTSG